MTRSEAAKICQSIKFLMDKEDYSEEVEEALNMAIEALDQEETLQNLTKPNKSDLISRQAAIDTVMGFMPSLTTPDGCGQFDREIFEAQEMFVDIGQALNKLPSAQPFTEEQIQTMQELESAQVEKAFELGKADRPTGHWIENAQEYYEMINEKCGGVDENTPYFTDDIACSECLAKFSVIDNETERFDFCPNCGCAMKGGEEE